MLFTIRYANEYLLDDINGVNVLVEEIWSCAVVASGEVAADRVCGKALNWPGSQARMLARNKANF